MFRERANYRRAEQATNAAQALVRPTSDSDPPTTSVMKMMKRIGKPP